VSQLVADSFAETSCESLYRNSNLTRRQMLMWIGQKMQPQETEFNMGCLFVVQGVLDEDAFCAAAQALVDGLDAMRTIIEERGGVPFQRVLPHLDAAVERVDLSRAGDGDSALREWARAAAQQPFALSQRLFSLTLLRLPANRSAWFLRLHHIAFDGCAVRLMFEHLEDLYAQALDGQRPALIKAPRFSEFVAHERAYAETPQYHEDVEYWQRQVGNPEDPILFYGRSVVATSSQAERYVLDLGPERSRRLRELAAEHGGFLGMHAAQQNLLAVALLAYLHRIGPNENLRLASAFHNRPPEFAQTVGLLMQTLPLPFSLSENETYLSLLDKVANASFEALEHSRYAVANPLHRKAWDVVLNYLPTRFDAFSGLALHPEWIFPGSTNAALTMTAHDFLDVGTLSLHIDVRLESFPATHREHVAPHFLNVLDAMLTDLHAPIAAVDYLTAAERQQIMVDFNATAADLPLGTFVERFEDSIVEYFDQTAIDFEGRKLSYRVLNALANRLAHHLRRQGIRPGVAVGICCRPGPDSIVAILATLKAGGAYVPIEPTTPPERLAFIVEDCGAALLLTQQSLVARMPALTARVLAVDGLDLESESAANPQRLATPASVAYMIYTSGSTGQPKGVRIPHASLVNFLEAVKETWVQRGDRCSQLSPLSFDMSIGDVMLPLLVGATLCPVARELAADGKRLMAYIEDARINAMFATPATFRILIEAGWTGTPGLKVLCGGEAMPPDLAEALLSRVASLQNVYGPTETTCYVTAYDVRDITPIIPIGKPGLNTQIYLLDKHFQPVPVGVPGELVIGGAQLGLDYLNRPELTSEKFIPDPFSGRPGARLYRSGDLARWREDGFIEHLGRIDHQVKIRGFRIELGEIENVLASHPQVQSNLVMAREDSPGDRRLVAYLVCPGGPPTVSDLKTHVRQKLPEYMVPAAFVFVDEFKLTPNGKVDRKALPAPQYVREQPDVTEAPRDLLEFQLVKLFEDVLNIQPVSPHDSFFELGGNSLLAVKLLAQIERILNKQIGSLMTLYEAPTPATLAAVLRKDGWQPALGTLVPLQPHGTQSPFFCVHAFIGDVNRDLGRHCGSEHPFYGLQPRGLDGREEPLRTIPDMARFYIEEIRRVQPSGPYYLGGYSFGGLVAYEMARQLRAAGEEIALLAVIDVPPRGMRPRSMRGRLRALANIPLELAEKIYDMCQERRLWSSLLRKLRSFMIKRRMAKIESAEAVEQYDGAIHMVERMYGMARWPQNYQRIARLNLIALLHYRPEPYDGPLTLIRRNGRGSRFGLENEVWGWDELVTHVDVHVVEGTHDEIMNEPRVRAVGEIMQSCLRRARAAMAPSTASQVMPSAAVRAVAI
jgi:amino acid adenylation domain-containing protein